MIISILKEGKIFFDGCDNKSIFSKKRDHIKYDLLYNHSLNYLVGPLLTTHIEPSG